MSAGRFRQRVLMAAAALETEVESGLTAQVRPSFSDGPVTVQPSSHTPDTATVCALRTETRAPPTTSTPSRSALVS